MSNNSPSPISLSVVSKYLLIIILPFFIFLANFNYLAFNKNFYGKIQNGLKSDLNLEDRIHYTNNVINYYQGKELLDKQFYSYQAQLHLLEVKNLLNATRVILGLSIIIILSLIIIITHEKRYESIFTMVSVSSIICVVTIGALGFGLTNYFDSIFLQMHHVLFANTFWLFPPDDMLVQVFPNEFFVLFANRFVLNTLITCVVLLIVSALGKILVRRHNFK